MDRESLNPLLKQISQQLHVGVDVLFALISIESSGLFEIGKGKIPILLERHKVWKFYQQKYGRRAALALREKHPDICNPNSGGYGRYRDQYKRLAKAIHLCGAEIAHKSTSFGAFQIMGFNHKDCGFNSAVEMSDAFHKDPMWEQVKAFLNFCKHYREGELLNAMREGNFTRIAYLYNGRNYRKNRYAQRMAIAAGEWRREDQGYLMNDGDMIA